MVIPEADKLACNVGLWTHDELWC